MSLKTCSGAAQAATTNQMQNDYTACHDARDEFLLWAEANGVIAPRLEHGSWIPTNAPHSSYDNDSLAVMLGIDCVLARNVESGDVYRFVGAVE